MSETETAPLTQAKAVLHSGLLSADYIFVDAEQPAGSKHVVGHVVVVDKDLWADMGRPKVITVTIEPGDKLN